MLPQKNRIYLILALIILLGSLLRIYGLERESLEGDELLRWHFASYDNLRDVIDPYNKWWHPHPPAYEVFLHFLIKYVGDSEFTLRLPSAIAGILSIFIIFQLGSKLYTYKEGLMAAALMAVLQEPVFFSQNMRPYSILLFLALLSTYLLFLLLEAVDSRRAISRCVPFGYVIVAIVSSYLHYFGLMLILLQSVASFFISFRRGVALKEVAVIYSIVFLAYLPWLPVLLGHFNDTRNSMTGNAWPGGNTLLLFLLWSFNYSWWMLVFFLIIFSAYALGNFYQSSKQGKGKVLAPPTIYTDLLLLLWIVVPYALLYLKSASDVPFLNYFYLIISLPAVYLLASRAIASLPFKVEIISIMACCVVILSLYDLVYEKHYYSNIQGTQYREAVNYVVENDRQYINSTIVGCSFVESYFNYYFTHLGSEKRVNVMVCQGSGDAEDINTLDNAMNAANPEYVWFIRGDAKLSKGAYNYLKSNATLVDNKTFYRAEVWLFQRA